MSSDEDTENGGGDGLRRCAACSYKRKRCGDDCILAPHFPASDAQRYESVRRFFGRRNVARMLKELPAEKQEAAADSLATEAQWRDKDPVYGCAGVIHGLLEEISTAWLELAQLRAQTTLHAHHAQQLQDHQEITFDQKELEDHQEITFDLEELQDHQEITFDQEGLHAHPVQLQLQDQQEMTFDLEEFLSNL